MDLDLLFQQYYFQYRTEAQIPNNQDGEFTIFVGLANEAINRWSNYDNTFWKELYQTNQIDASADLTIQTGKTAYATPNDMRIAGGYLRIYDQTTGQTKKRVKIVEPQDVQFQADTANYCYFIGNPNSGFTMQLNPEPDAVIANMAFDYVYYKKPNLLASSNDTPEMSQPYFIIHRALANRFRGSRNPYYESAKSDAEDVLKTMQMENNSGNWSNPWKLADHTGGTFGDSVGHGGYFE